MARRIETSQSCQQVNSFDESELATLNGLACIPDIFIKQKNIASNMRLDSDSTVMPRGCNERFHS